MASCTVPLLKKLNDDRSKLEMYTFGGVPCCEMANAKTFMEKVKKIGCG
jgi:hypothetical protein